MEFSRRCGIWDCSKLQVPTSNKVISCIIYFPFWEGLVSGENFHWTRKNLDMCPRVNICVQSNVFSENFHRMNPLLDFRISLGSMGSKSTYKHRSDIGLRKKKKKRLLGSHTYAMTEKML